MKLHKNRVVVALLVLFAAVQSNAAAPALKVLSAAPKGQQGEMGRQEINVHFNQPVVALGEESQFASKDCPLTITPRVEGTCRFNGTQTLTFEPAANWPAAQQFTVTIAQGFTSKVSGQKLAQAYTFSFQTQVPRVLSVWPYDQEHWISLTPTLYVLTSMPLSLNKAGRFVKLSSPQHAVPVELSVPSEAEIKQNFSYLSKEEKQNLFAVRPVEPLKMGQRYALSLEKGLPAQTGNIGMEKTHQTVFYTYPALSVESVISTGCLPFTPAIRFSTPVRKQEMWTHLDVQPAAAKQELLEREKQSVGDSFSNPKTGEAYFSMPLSFIRLQAHQPVQVTLRKGMRDIYNNVLAQDYSFTIQNDGYCPAVDFSADGVGVLESYLPARLPVDLMNIASLPVEAARFSKEDFIPFYEKDNSFCAKKPLAQAVFSGDYTFKDVKDKTYKTYIDLSRFNPTTTQSIIFSQFKIKRQNQNEDCWLSSTDNITDVGVTFKTSAENILIWITSLKTGQPLANMHVQLRGKDNKVVWQGTTNADGIVAAPGWGKLDVPDAKWGQPALYAFVTSVGGDAVVSNLWNDGLEPWRFNVDYEYNPAAQTLHGYLFTERGIYRPQETVHVKGILRQLKDGSWHLPLLQQGKLKITDSRGEEVVAKTVSVSPAWGTFDASFDIPATAATGYWEASFIPAGKEQQEPLAYASFQVEAVKQAEFNIDLRAGSSQYLALEKATFSTSAQYYFGAPLAGAKTKWTLRQEPASFSAKGYDQYTFIPYFLRRNESTQEDKVLLSGSGELDAHGALEFTAQMPQTPLPLRVYAEVDIQSPARQNLFKRTSVLVHPADLYVGAKPAKDSYEAGQPVEIELVAVTPQGKPTQTTATAQLYREEYYSVRKVGLAGRLEWVSEKKVTPLPSQTVTISKKGGKLTFTPQQAGSYYIELTAADMFGRTVKGGVDVYVYGKGQSYGPRKDDDLLKLTQNKNEYKVGQKARIRVESPYQTANVLVTVEREGVLDSWTTQFSGGTNYVEVPIKPNYLPNVYVSVTAVQGRTAKPADYKEDLGKPQGKMGYVNLNVVPDAKRITTTLKTNAAKYQPGQEVQVQLNTKVNGKAVPAEVVVMAVDEGVLALSNYQTPDLFAQFYGSKPLSVFTMDNRAYVIGQRSFGEKGENRGGGGAAQSKLAGTDLRSRFEFTPFYAAAVHTDGKGQAKVSFTLPDNLTTFRVMAVDLTPTEFGNAQQSITVSKPVMATPSLPRFARVGDQFSCGIILYNYEDEKGIFQVQPQAQGTAVQVGNLVQTVTVPKGQSREVLWPCRAVSAGEARLTFSAQGRYSDAVEQSLQVSLPSKEQTLGVSGFTTYTKDEKTTQPANVNPAAFNRVVVSVASTALLQLKGAFAYLLDYPYNCLEQQISKMMPAVSARQLVSDFKLADAAELRKQAQQIISNIPAYQHASGGYGYWPGSSPDPYVTAYALEHLRQAQQAGFTVPEKSIQKAVAWLENAFNSHAVRSYEYVAAETNIARAYSAYVLAGYGKNIDSLFNTLYQTRTGLAQEAVAYLLQAAQLTQRPPEVKVALAQQLIGHLTYSGESAYVSQRSTFPWVHSDNVTATAHTLHALLVAGFKPDVAPQMAAWLVGQISAQGRWNNTQSNAAAVQALQKYYEVFESEDPNFTATVTQAYQTRLSDTFQGRSLQQKTATVPFAQVYQGGPSTHFTFAKQGAGTLYYTLSQIYTPSAYETPVQAGFSVTRQLRSLAGTAVQKIVPGERYKVTLQIQTAADRTFVAAEDYIPAGFTLVNTNLATESSSQAQALDEENSSFARVEQYDDRIYAFADVLPAGTHTFSYLVTATSPGTYTYPAAWVSQMYEPSVFGRTATQSIVIQ